MIEYFAALNASIDLAKRLKEISKNIENAEFKNLVADLYNELGDAKMAMAELKEKNAELMEENQALKTAKPENKQIPKVAGDGIYEFDDEEGYFCSGCFDSRGQKARLSLFFGHVYQCTQCKTTYSLN